MSKLKIALLTPTKNSMGGVETFNQNLKKILEERGHSLDFITLELLKTSNKLSGSEKELAQYFNGINKKEDYNLVICNGEYGYGVDHPAAINFFHGNYLGYAESVQHLVPQEKTKWRLERVFIQRESAKGKYVISNSNFNTFWLEKSGIKVDKTINLSIDDSLFKFCPNKIIPSFPMAASRGMYFEKGFDILEQWSKLRAGIINFFGEFEGKLNGIKKKGHIENRKLVYEYNRANIFLNPSRFESAGLTTLEAMSCGCPLITTPTGYGCDIRNKIPEFVVKDFQNFESFCENWDKINSNRLKYSKRAIEYFKEFHDPERFKKEIISIVENI